MKKFGLFTLIVLLLFLTPLQTIAASHPSIDAKAYFLMEAQSGAILAQKNSNQPLPPASMTKMMSELIILEMVKQGKLHWEESVTTSPRAAAINEAQIHLESGEKETVREMFIAMSVYSANDATVALAEHVAGSEEKFVQWMNQKAEELQLQQTHFRNSTGLGMDDYLDPPKIGGKHVMSAHDAARLARYLLQNHKELFTMTAIPTYTFHKGSHKEMTLKNWNHMLTGLAQSYAGVDGLKTGFTDEAGYCFTGTAKRGEYRMISVVMGTASEEKRFTETAKLLNYGFGEFEFQTLLTAKQPPPQNTTIFIPNGVKERVPVVINEPIQLPIHKNKWNQYQYHVTFYKNIKAPLAKGEVVGDVQILFQGKKIQGVDSIPLVTASAVEEASWVRLLIRNITNTISKWFS